MPSAFLRFFNVHSLLESKRPPEVSSVSLVYACSTRVLIHRTSVFAGNRDEFLDRPTAPAHFWPEAPEVLAGTDLEESATPGHNGTWLGITRSGRFSALTNYREQKYLGRRSRGILVRDFLLDNTVSPKDYMERLEPESQHFGGFSLLCIDLSDPQGDGYYYCNRDDTPITKLDKGQIYGKPLLCSNLVRVTFSRCKGLSNTVLTKPWEKVTRGKSLLDKILHDHQERNGTEEDLVEDLFAMLG